MPSCVVPGASLGRVFFPVLEFVTIGTPIQRWPILPLCHQSVARRSFCVGLRAALRDTGHCLPESTCFPNLESGRAPDPAGRQAGTCARWSRDT